MRTYIIFLIYLSIFPLANAADSKEQRTDTAVANESVSTASNNNDKTKTNVTRGIFTSGISNREPIDNLKEMANNRHKVFFFSELVGLSGQKVTHRWLFKDEVKAEIAFQIKGERWRVYSSKNLMPTWTGTWTVQIAAEDGTVIDSKFLDFINAPKTAGTSENNIQ